MIFSWIPLGHDCSKPHREESSPLFLLCDDLTSHISFGMKIKFKDSSVPDNSDKVRNAKVCMTAMNICNSFFFFSPFVWRFQAVYPGVKNSSLVASATMSVMSRLSKCQVHEENVSSLRVSYNLGNWLYKGWQHSWFS